MRYSTVTISRQMMLVSITAIVPLLSITVYVISTSINKDINFGALERKGTLFQRPLERILDLVPQQQDAARKSAAGDSDARNRLPGLDGQIDKAIETLGVAQETLGKELKFTEAGLASCHRENASFPALQSDWTRLKNATPAEIANGTLEDKVVGVVRTMITHAGDTSNLILDPDLDSYYLMDMTLCALPQTQERLSVTIRQVPWRRPRPARNSMRKRGHSKIPSRICSPWWEPRPFSPRGKITGRKRRWRSLEPGSRPPRRPLPGELPRARSRTVLATAFPSCGGNRNLRRGSDKRFQTPQRNRHFPPQEISRITDKLRMLAAGA